MSVSLSVDDKALKLNPFMSNLTTNIILALAKSLKAAEGKRIEFLMEADDLRLLVDTNEVSLDIGHAKQIAGNVLRGLLKSVHGAESGRVYRFTYES